MGIFHSILHHLTGWVNFMQRRPVDEVLQWLRENDLIEYFSNFVEHGWDHLAVIAEMTENDIEMCIQKPGHKVKLKRAIAVLKGNQSIIPKHVMDKNSDQNSMKAGSTECPYVYGSTEEISNQDSKRIATTERQNASSSDNSHQDSKRTGTKESILSSSQTYSNQSEDTQSSIHSLHVSQSCSPGDSKSSTTQSQFDTDIKHAVESVDVINMDIPNKPEGPISIPVVNQNYDVEDHDHGKIVPCVDDQNSDIDMETTCDLETSISDGTDNSETETDTNRALEDTIGLGFGDAAMISEEMDEPQNIVALSRNTHELPLSAATAEGTTVNLTIIKHSEHTSITDHATNKIEPEYERNVHNSDCLHDQMEAIASVDEEKDALYVETRAYEELKTIIEHSYCATILGKPGDGESATAVHLLLYYQRTKGYQPIYITSVRQWELLISGNESSKQFVVIDDMFGSTALDARRTDEWLFELEKMEKLVEKRQGTLMVVCTSRRHIFTDAEPKLYKSSRFKNRSIVDMTDKGFKLSSSEKLDIFKKYATKFAVEFNEEILSQIEAIDSPHGFPHCVEMFCKNAFLRENGILFFKNPEEFVQKELHNFKDNDPVKFLVLLLVLYKKNCLHTRYFGEMLENVDEEAEKLFKFTGVPMSTSYTSLLKAVNALTHTYLTKTGDGYYTFTHESLKENVSSVYISLNSVHATKLLDFQQILTHISKPISHVRLPVNDLAERITIEIFSGNVGSVGTCASWRDQEFVNEWIGFATLGLNSLSDALSKCLIRRTLISKPFKAKLWWSTPESLIVSLLENKMYNAVIAILNCKKIQKVLGQDEDCLKILERGLEIVCEGGHNIQVIKNIVAFQQATNSKMLDGSASLANALRASDPEIALYLIDHTTIQVRLKGIQVPSRSVFAMYDADYIQILFTSTIDLENFKRLLPFLIHKCERNKLLSDYIILSKTNFCSKTFEYIIQLNKDIDASWAESETDIVRTAVEHLTAQQCQYALTILKTSNVNMRYVNKSSMNVLHTICKKKKVSQYFDVLKYLVDAGVDPSQETRDGVVPLMFALKNDPGEDCLRWLLSISPQRHTDKNDQGYFYYLLQSRCSFEHLINYCNVLREANEIINLPDATGTTPAMHFLQNPIHHRQDIHNFTSFLTFLHLAEIDFHRTNDEGINILHTICMKWNVSQYFDVLRALVDAGVDPSQQTDEGVVPLMYALENDLGEECLRWLLSISPKRHTDKNGQGYFHYLLQAGCSFECLENYCNILLEANENINLPDASGATPIMYFLQHSLFHTRSIQSLASFLNFLCTFLNFLYSSVIDLHLTDNKGRNVLHYTFQAQKTTKSTTPNQDKVISTVFDFLVKTANVDCFLADKNGVNPIMVALENYSETRTVRKFLNHNIPDQVDKDGNTNNHYLKVSKEKLEKEVIGCALNMDALDDDHDLMDTIAASDVNNIDYDDYYDDYCDEYDQGSDADETITITQNDVDRHFVVLEEAIKNSMASSQCSINL